MILKIRKYGDKVLREMSTPVEKIDEEILKILDDMVETMKNAQGVGLAAPQVGINKNMFVLDVGDGKIRKIVNPEFIEISKEEVENEEGCLSIPGIYKKVRRAERVKLKYLNEKGEEVVEEGTDLLGRAFQHEYDHLKGELFVDKISPVAKRLVSSKLSKLKKETEKEGGN
ncbi:MAG: peptide deformylase [Fusobacteriaceae bacterium]|nr:peptide deformylase [Fusobacteriaceae bacterium]MBN2837727.1 peptide deformylase [Fusobacteriaceae bacterium]